MGICGKKLVSIGIGELAIAFSARSKESIMITELCEYDFRTPSDDHP
jgi:hypothetical protein